MPKHTDPSSGKQPKEEITFAEFLVDSGNNSLAFLGKCMTYFGTKSIIAFFLGAALVYLYAMFKPLPFFAFEPQRIILQGNVNTLDGKPLAEQFMVGILENRPAGPFASANGSFNLLVPKREMYDIAVWNQDYSTFNLYGNMKVEQKDGHYELSIPVVFPTGLGRIVGEVKDKDDRPVKGTVLAGGRCAPIGPDGTFELKHIPLAKVTLSVKDENQQSLYEEEIFMELNQQTPKFINIIRE